jgi:glycerol-3-phosphate dehydrogenase
MDYDVAVIGAGIVGLCIADELSRYKIRIACVEKEGAVAQGASGNNSGVIHSGINLKPESMKARFCVQGNRMMYGLCEKLDVPCKRGGTLVAASSDDEVKVLEELKRRADMNGVENVRFVDEAEIKNLEPHVRGIRGLFSPSGGITLPKILCKALADDAEKNGVRFYFNSKVSDIEQGEKFRLKVGKDAINSVIVVNSAGLYADDVAAMAGYTKYRIQPWLGEYYIINKELINSMVYPAPQFGAAGLGIHLTRSLEGHVLVGPNATKMENKETKFRSPPDDFYKAVSAFIPDVRIDDLKYGYSGIRAKLAGAHSVLDADFVIEEYPDDLIHLMGIESPGLTSAPALATHVVEMIGRKMDLRLK